MTELTSSINVGTVMLMLLSSLIGVAWHNLNEKIRTNHRDARERIDALSSQWNNAIEAKLRVLEDALARSEQQSNALNTKIEQLQTLIQKFEVHMATHYVEKSELRNALEHTFVGVPAAKAPKRAKR